MQTESIRSPYDGSVVGEMPVCSQADVDRSIERAQRGYQAMRRLPRFVRADILDRAAGLVRAQRTTGPVELLVHRTRVRARR